MAGRRRPPPPVGGGNGGGRRPPLVRRGHDPHRRRVARGFPVRPQRRPSPGTDGGARRIGVHLLPGRPRDRLLSVVDRARRGARPRRCDRRPHSQTRRRAGCSAAGCDPTDDLLAGDLGDRLFFSRHETSRLHLARLPGAGGDHRRPSRLVGGRRSDLHPVVPRAKRGDRWGDAVGVVHSVPRRDRDRDRLGTRFRPRDPRVAATLTDRPDPGGRGRSGLDPPIQGTTPGCPRGARDQRLPGGHAAGGRRQRSGWGGPCRPAPRRRACGTSRGGGLGRIRERSAERRFLCRRHDPPTALHRGGQRPSRGAARCPPPRRCPLRDEPSFPPAPGLRGHCQRTSPVWPRPARHRPPRRAPRARRSDRCPTRPESGDPPGMARPSP